MTDYYSDFGELLELLVVDDDRGGRGTTVDAFDLDVVLLLLVGFG